MEKTAKLASSRRRHAVQIISVFMIFCVFRASCCLHFSTCRFLYKFGSMFRLFWLF